MEGIRAQGWKYVNSKECSCGVKFEWHKKWNQDRNKFDFLPIEYHDATATFVNHFVPCPHRADFRKKKAAEKEAKGLSKKQLAAKKREEKEAEREAAKGPRLF